jgi:hypothetical protein
MRVEYLDSTGESKKMDKSRCNWYFGKGFRINIHSSGHNILFSILPANDLILIIHQKRERENCKLVLNSILLNPKSVMSKLC